MNSKISQNIEKYNSHYSESGLWSKIKSVELSVHDCNPSLLPTT